MAKPADNPHTFTKISRDANVVLIEIFCASPEHAQRTMRHLEVTLAEGREIRITLPNASMGDSNE